MSEQDNKYQNGKIYMIFSDQSELFYIGSTTNTIERRLYQHKDNYERTPELIGRVRKLFDTVGINNIKIKLIKNIPAENKDQLLIAEREEYDKHIQNPNFLNYLKPYRTEKEKEEDKQEKILERKQLVKCDKCGKQVSKRCFNDHIKNETCQKLMKQKQQIEIEKFSKTMEYYIMIKNQEQLMKCIYCKNKYHYKTIEEHYNNKECKFNQLPKEEQNKIIEQQKQQKIIDEKNKQIQKEEQSILNIFISDIKYIHNYQKQKQLIKCEKCGEEVSKHYFCNHKKSQKCFINSMSEEDRNKYLKQKEEESNKEKKETKKKWNDYYAEFIECELCHHKYRRDTLYKHTGNNQCIRNQK